MKDLFKPIPYNAKSEYYTEPIFDLLYKVDCKNACKILDIGCGTGNSTKAISLFFPNADILGIDNSNSINYFGLKNPTDLPKLKDIMLPENRIGEPSENAHVFEASVVEQEVKEVVDNDATIETENLTNETEKPDEEQA